MKRNSDRITTDCLLCPRNRMWNSWPVIDESEMCSPFLQEFINLTILTGGSREVLVVLLV